MRNALLGFLVFVLNALMSAPGWASDGHHGEEMRGGNGTVVFVAHDYGFRGPDQIPACLTPVRILNEGQDLHHIQFLR